MNGCPNWGEIGSVMNLTVKFAGKIGEGCIVNVTDLDSTNLKDTKKACMTSSIKIEVFSAIAVMIKTFNDAAI